MAAFLPLAHSRCHGWDLIKLLHTWTTALLPLKMTSENTLKVSLNQASANYFLNIRKCAVLSPVSHNQESPPHMWARREAFVLGTSNAPIVSIL